VPSHGGDRTNVPEGNVATVEDIGITQKKAHEGPRWDAERDETVPR
jgi:hypothetical protein